MYLKTGTWVLEAGHDRRGDPAWVGQDKGQEKVGVDLVSETAHFSGIAVKMIAGVTLSFGRSSLEINKNGCSHEEGHEADGVAHEINVGENL